MLFDLASGSDPGTSVDVAEAAAHQAAATLADGAPHYFHLVTCDRAGNCAPPIETGPFQVDTQAPVEPGAGNVEQSRRRTAALEQRRSR